jgi:hypothetical protein
MRKYVLAAAVIVAASIAVPLALAANAYNGTAPLVHQGLNPPQCAAPFTGTDSTASGVVNVHFNAKQQRFKVNVSVHHALPNRTYVVDDRCFVPFGFAPIGTLTTNSQGTGTAHIEFPWKSVPPTFYIDIAVPPNVPGGPFGGAGGYGDTFIAGPFTLG